jgi:hypothetical protein
LHSFQYAYSNPVNWIDPSGHLAIFFRGGFGDTTNEDARLNNTFELGRNLQKKNLIPGEAFFLGPASVDDAVTLILDSLDEGCKTEPIVLLGYSRGGAAVQYVLEQLLHKAPELQIDLAVTIAPVQAFQRLDIPMNVVRENVRRHVNITSGQRMAASDNYPNYHIWPDNLPAIEDVIPGADRQEVVEKTHHFGVITAKMPLFKPDKAAKNGYAFIRYEDPNPVWSMVEEEFRNTHDE